MNPGRSRLEIGCYGDINVSKTSTRKYRAETRYRRLGWRSPQGDCDRRHHLPFFTRNGTPLAPYKVRRTLRKMLADAGLEHLEITPHGFRRTGATVIARASRCGDRGRLLWATVRRM